MSNVLEDVRTVFRQIEKHRLRARYDWEAYMAAARALEIPQMWENYQEWREEHAAIAALLRTLHTLTQNAYERHHAFYDADARYDIGRRSEEAAKAA